MELNAVKTVFICGPVASGKTHLIQTLLRTKPNFLIIDTTFEFEDDEFEHVWKNPQELCRLLGVPGDHKIVYHPGKNLHNSFQWCSEAYWLLDYPRWLVLDECHEYALHDNFNTLMRYARKRKLGVLLASQRIADVPKSVTANSRMIIIFYSCEARDYLAVRDRFGVEVAEAMKNLKPLLYNDETQTVEQTPEVIVYERGKGVTVHDLATGRIRLLNSSETISENLETGTSSATIAENSSENLNEEPLN